jgi:transposase, IS30 family
MSSGNELTDDDRDRIMMGISRERTFRMIAADLGRNHSVVSREVARNGGRAGYRSRLAAKRAEQQKARPQKRKPGSNKELHDAVADRLNRRPRHTLNSRTPAEKLNELLTNQPVL